MLFMSEISDYILHLLNKKKFCDEWIQSKYKQKPIIIMGPPGSGKTKLAEYILKEFTQIYIGTENIKQIRNFTEYLNDILFKKSITMLFNSKNHYKSIIFDDLELIKNNDKQLFQSIIINAVKNMKIKFFS